MKKSFLVRVLFICSFCFVVIPSHAATISISGSFGNSQDLFGNLPAGSYPYAQLFGGSFSGTFDYDSSSTPVGSNSSFTSYAMTSVFIDIINNTGTTINTITNQSPENNTLRAANDGSYIDLIFGYSGGIINGTEDLRINFNSSFTTGTGNGPTISDINATAFDTTPNSSFLETDGAAAFTFWDLEVTSASMSGTAVPVPAAAWLFGSGLLGIVALARRRVS